MKKVLTSESVNIGHPDKTCDYIADCFLDEALRQDSRSQMAVECAIKDNKLFIYGEATTKAKIDYDLIARQCLKEIGYEENFDIDIEVSEQSIDINNAVEKKVVASNDQGIVFGYATNETPEYLPMTIVIAHKLMKVYNDFQKCNSNFFADAKSQVSIEYQENRPIKLDTLLLSVSHSDKITHDEICNVIKANVIDKVLEEYKDIIDINDYVLLVNPSGRFVIWGSKCDSGCVGRKIVVDSYGGQARVGGGCFSSKNPTKVDRSGAYYSRYVAKNIVANNLADKVEIEVSYAIGKTKPLSMNIQTFGTEKVELQKIYEFVDKNFDFGVANMIEELDLVQPIYSKTACFGHFGRDGFSWEKLKKVK